MEGPPGVMARRATSRSARAPVALVLPLGVVRSAPWGGLTSGRLPVALGHTTYGGVSLSPQLGSPVKCVDCTKPMGPSDACPSARVLLKIMRKSGRISAAALAGEAGMSAGHLGRLERGERPIHSEDLTALLKGLAKLGAPVLPWHTVVLAGLMLRPE